MPKSTIRLSVTGFTILEQIADLTGKKKIDILDEALSGYAEHLFWNQVDAAYIEHGTVLQDEYHLFENAIADGLTPESV